MFPAFGYTDAANQLGDYCRDALLVDDARTHPPAEGNKIWEIYKCLKLTDELIAIFDRLEIFKTLAAAGYRLREEPTLIRWTCTGKNRGAADHYHHDGHFGKGGQVSLMLLLEENMGMTHMRLIPDSRRSFGRKIYDALWKIPFRGRGRLFRLNDLLLETFNKPIKLEGPKDRLYYFNAGDNLHKAYPVTGTTRTIFHLNLTLFESRLDPRDLAAVKLSNHAPYWRKLLAPPSARA